MRVKLGPLEASLQKGIGQSTNFQLTNPKDEKVQQAVKFESDGEIKNVIFTTGEEYISILSGGIGENYITYNINIAANETASGVIVSADRVKIKPIFD